MVKYLLDFILKMASSPMLRLLRTEPPTTDVEICCRFEDIATEGHAAVRSRMRCCSVHLAVWGVAHTPFLFSSFFFLFNCHPLAPVVLAPTRIQTHRLPKLLVLCK